MSALTQLLLSNNLLSGVVPRFPPYVKVVTSGGNKDLINASLAHRPGKKNPISMVAFIPGVVMGLFLVVMTVGFVLISGRFNRIKGHWISEDCNHRLSIDFSKAMDAVCKSEPVNIMVKTEFYTYYEALMPCGKKYCIKKLNWSTKAFQLRSHAEVAQELTVLGRLSDSNLMIPLAYVLTARSAFVFYEYPPHGTLFDLLHGSRENVVNWESRYNIAVGIGRALAFLHGCSAPACPIVVLHLSTKSILMKSIVEPLIGDFELGKVMNPSTTMGTLSVVAGSVGYIPPEYAYTMRMTASGNVYSFGIIMLELLTGKPAISEGTELAKWVLNESNPLENWEEIVDSRVSRTSPEAEVHHQMQSILRIALQCISISPHERPDSQTLLNMLIDVVQ